MSEFLNNSQLRRRDLTAFCYGILDGENGKALMERYAEALAHVTPHDTVYVVDELVKKYPVDAVKKAVGKILNVFHLPVSSYVWEQPEDDSFLGTLMRENAAMRARMNHIKSLVRSLNELEPLAEKSALLAELGTHIRELREFHVHYVKKENILFPYLEKMLDDYRCLMVMWSMHDDIRASQKRLEQLTEVTEPDMDTLNRELGVYFFAVMAIIYREDSLLFPVAFERLPKDIWHEMLEQSFIEGFAFIDPPKRMAVSQTKNTPLPEDGLVDLGTGSMTPEQIAAVLNMLPVDITFVDENDRVKYFSDPKHRIFPRSKAIIGREVQNCHPPDSVHVVNEIVDALKAGEKEKASFWIQMKGQFILIQYFPVRNAAGDYLGTLEVSQDITEARSLTGEKRLLDW